MWRTVLGLEWRILKKDRSALAILGIFALFLVGASIAGGRQATLLSDSQLRAVQGESARLTTLEKNLTEVTAKQGQRRSKDPRDPVWMGKEGAVHLAVLPPAPLASIAVGQRDLHPQIVQVSTEVELAAERETETPMSGPSRLSTGAFDPAFLFVVLFPLVIIALSYELLSGERERGTLAMLLAQPVSQGELVLGKASARVLALCSVTMIFALVGLLVAGADLTTGSAWVQVGLYAAILVSWALFWFALAVWVNARGQTSAGNALSLVGVWLVLVVVVPGLIHIAVDTLYPPPSKLELMHEAREAAEEVNQALSGLKGRHDRDTTTKTYAKDVVKAQDALLAKTEPLMHELQDTLRQRQDVVNWLRFLSPAIVVQLALEDVAGSGAVRNQRFDEQLDEFHPKFRAFFFEKIKGEKDLSVADLKSRPTLVFAEEPVGALCVRVFGGVAGLLLIALILLLTAWPRLKRIGRLTA